MTQKTPQKHPFLTPFLTPKRGYPCVGRKPKKSAAINSALFGFWKTQKWPFLTILAKNDPFWVKKYPLCGELAWDLPKSDKIDPKRVQNGPKRVKNDPKWSKNTIFDPFWGQKVGFIPPPEKGSLFDPQKGGPKRVKKHPFLCGFGLK